MSPDKEYREAWYVSLQIDALRAELEKKVVTGRYGRARRKQLEAQLATKRNRLTLPASYGAAVWQRRAIGLVRLVQAHLNGYGDELLSFQELVTLAMTLPAMPEEQTVARFLNRMGYRGKLGRPKKT
ncbi:hypothetical protein [Paraburkholderia gardini]|uniref:Transposase n=1 Tax=Paraburkholderia gardini TaxID=2823469 RepID=A0ABM8U665_9BURK|nr:hypothetical protein [Paraburkholderia gardini]CAG4907415.1 hypothetical protein R54767_03404 [Paraburkholderia gardini]